MLIKRTISMMTGKGSINHNSRKFHAENTVQERSHLNVEYCCENIKDVYHELFDEAVERYNEKQKRKDRQIEDYFEKISQDKKKHTCQCYRNGVVKASIRKYMGRDEFIHISIYRYYCCFCV